VLTLLRRWRFDRLGRVLVASVLAIALGACGEPRDAGYYLTHPDVRAAELARCAQLYNSSSDAQCRAAAYADNQAIEAEHGPPFHGHDAAWYRVHFTQHLQEKGYCLSRGGRATSDPDCVAAATPERLHF
jgi:hypothetical protein